MAEENTALLDRLNALGDWVKRLEAEIADVKSELSAKADKQQRWTYEKIMEIEKEYVRLTSAVDKITERLEGEPTFEGGFTAKVTQFSLFLAAAIIGAAVVRWVGHIIP